MRVDFSNHREVNIGDVVFSRKSDQMGVVLSKSFDFSSLFIVEVMLESGLSINVKGNGDGSADLETTSSVIDLARIHGRSDPYGKVIEVLRQIRSEAKKHVLDGHAIG